MEKKIDLSITMLDAPETTLTIGWQHFILTDEGWYQKHKRKATGEQPKTAYRSVNSFESKWLDWLYAKAVKMEVPDNVQEHVEFEPELIDRIIDLARDNIETFRGETQLDSDGLRQDLKRGITF